MIKREGRSQLQPPDDRYEERAHMMSAWMQRFAKGALPETSIPEIAARTITRLGQQPTGS